MKKDSFLKSKGGWIGATIYGLFWWIGISNNYPFQGTIQRPVLLLIDPVYDLLDYFFDFNAMSTFFQTFTQIFAFSLILFMIWGVGFLVGYFIETLWKKLGK